MAMKQYIDHNYRAKGNSQTFEEMKSLRSSVCPASVKKLVDDVMSTPQTEMERLLKKALHDPDVIIWIQDHMRGILMFRMRAELQCMEQIVENARESMSKVR